MKRSLEKQKGITLSGILTVCVGLGLIGILAAKVVPSVVEYTDILREVKAIAADPAVRGGSMRDIKTAFTKRADVAYIKSITAEDLDISKDGDEVVIEFAYAQKIPLFANASLVLDFEGSSTETE
jgi:hypothetical protein